MSVTEVAESVLHAIGHTPLVRLKRIVPPGSAEVFVKDFNPTGSCKAGWRRDDGAPSGARLRCTPFSAARDVAGDGLRGQATPRAAVVRCVRAREDSDDGAFGASVEIVPSDGGKVTPVCSTVPAHRRAETSRTPWTDQFHNADALNGYREIGVELLNQLRASGVLRRRHRRHAGGRLALKAADVARVSSPRAIRRRS